MVVSAALLMRERGARATSIDDVLAHSGAPRGSVYHHFPGGRDQLIRDATEYATRFVEGRLERRSDTDPVEALDAFVASYRDELLRTDLKAGCPIVAVAIEGRDGDDLQQLAGDAFARWEALLTRNFVTAGIRRKRARELATLVIASIEGALIMSRAQKTVVPLDSVRAQLRALLEAELRKDR
jgi:AcrR family transcriptional regulator